MANDWPRGLRRGLYSPHLLGRRTGARVERATLSGVQPRGCRSLDGRVVVRGNQSAEVAEQNLVMPSRPHSIRMLVEATMAQASLKPRIALEIESIPAILTLVRDEGVHAILSLKAVRSSGHENDFHVRPDRKSVV